MTGQLSGETFGTHIETLEDPSGVWTLKQVIAPAMSQRFVRSDDDAPNFGLSRSAYWIRFKVDNPRTHVQPWLLELAYPPLDDVRLFVPRARGGFDERKTGDHRPFAERDVEYATFMFQLDQPPGVQTYYMRVQTSGSVSLPLRAWSSAVFIEHLIADEPPVWIFYGLMLVMAAYNLFVYASVREIAHRR